MWRIHVFTVRPLALHPDTKVKCAFLARLVCLPDVLKCIGMHSFMLQC